MHLLRKTYISQNRACILADFVCMNVCVCVGGGGGVYVRACGFCVVVCGVVCVYVK